jgi:hypothetical protein
MQTAKKTTLKLETIMFSTNFYCVAELLSKKNGHINILSVLFLVKFIFLIDK